MEPNYIKFPGGGILTFGSVYSLLDLENGVISFSKPGNKTLVNYVLVEVNQKETIKIVFHHQKDGVHVTCIPTIDYNVNIQLVMRDKSKLGEFMRKLTAAIAAVICYQYFATESPLKASEAKAWIKTTSNKFFNLSRKIQGEAYSGSDKIFFDIITNCKNQIQELSGLTITSALDRVRKDFSLLNDHLSEEEVIRMWRESTISQVHET